MPTLATLADLDNRVLINRVAAVEGPLLLSLGGLHGNEPAGVHALMRVERAFENNVAFLKKGRIQAYAGNLPALQKSTRFQDFDMNRIWVKGHVEKLRLGDKSAVRCEEDVELIALLEQLDPHLEEHNTKYERIFLDLHSFSAPGGLFSLTMQKSRNAALAKVLKAPLIYGVIEHLVGTALHYFDELGFMSIGFEGGQHKDLQTIDNMESAIWVLLNHLEMVDFADNRFLIEHQERLSNLTQGLPNQVQLMYRHTVYEESAFEMRPGFKNFDEIKASDIVAIDRFGPIKAPCDGYMLMPLYQKKGEDGFFIVDHC